MPNFLYIIWFLLPIFFFVIALWSWLEKKGKKHGKAENPGDFLGQGVFVLVCVFICVGLNEYVLEDLSKLFFDSVTALSFIRVIILPLVLLIAAKIAGPTKQIRISKAPNSKNRLRKR